MGWRFRGEWGRGWGVGVGGIRGGGKGIRGCGAECGGLGVGGRGGSWGLSLVLGAV
jgi:hypothetical protein